MKRQEALNDVLARFLTNIENIAYVFIVSPPDSFGERVLGRSVWGGSCLCTCYLKAVSHFKRNSIINVRPRDSYSGS